MTSQVPPERLHFLLHVHKPPLQTTPTYVRIGRVTLPIPNAQDGGGGGGGDDGDDDDGSSRRRAAKQQKQSGAAGLAQTRPTLCLMERVGACVRQGEPVLLVGETGTGKTTAVQHLAAALGQTLLVHNLSEQSDSAELIGGYRPVQLRHAFAPLASRFELCACLATPTRTAAPCEVDHSPVR